MLGVNVKAGAAALAAVFGLTTGEQDEIYAKVDYTTWSDQHKNRKSNRVDGYYGCVLPIQC